MTIRPIPGSALPLVLDLCSPSGDETAAQRLQRGLAYDPMALLVTTDPEMLAALASLPAGAPDIAALVPNMGGYVRDAADSGLVGAALALLRRTSPRGLVRVGLVGGASAPGIVARDFGALSRVLVEVELAGLRRFRPTRIVLAAGVTDIPLAAGNRAFFAGFTRFVRRFHRAEPWLETCNVGHLLRSLREWDVDVAGVVTPLNPLGYGMKPALADCVKEISRSPVELWARDPLAGGSLSPAEAEPFLEQCRATATLATPDMQAAAR